MAIGFFQSGGGSSNSGEIGIRVERITSQPLTDSAVSIIEFDTLIRNDLGPTAWSLAQPDAIIIPSGFEGWWSIAAGTYLAGNEAGNNLVVFISQETVSPAADTPGAQWRDTTDPIPVHGGAVPDIRYLSEGDIIRLLVFNGATGKSTFGGGSDPFTFLALKK